MHQRERCFCADHRIAFGLRLGRRRYAAHLAAPVVPADQQIYLPSRKSSLPCAMNSWHDVEYRSEYSLRSVGYRAAMDFR